MVVTAYRGTDGSGAPDKNKTGCGAEYDRYPRVSQTPYLPVLV